MARIAGVTLPKEKRIEIALMYIFGIGPTLSKNILRQTGVHPDKRTKDLTLEEVNTLREAIEKGEYTIEGELRREIYGHVKRLRDIGSYRGMRHAKRLPVRGQRTRTNSRTIRGNVRRTTLSGRRTLEKT
ncbi:MAG: 30S ribosomal protein S13 [Candidatus Kerfeldbacteria bacterium RIFCSPHIGHO2_02_FULL_42_14]|uniref:Small ribosomal subunit protein uS13 n=1 Tax=Candidatus Kerfeldbacteria bacterium RIFCSPHIGHO2_02_FULL_42_14 TaxID=1798540 RepID=A0A1G2AQR2_9BACT|nr:MAG: 30S ribosomal protein S13 [Candidatus Kerfeldbacteria bacterium RIFCSPHIGHO2_02_FULL_42_14]OGY80629.1 MAG: 30S ribosomal protein S13 [Candidatus Kerfeldbacteria bacterium RIFCSPHIGHO2_12_FULL_42_13]OGY82553.1 MAG: 30S ribosomal protein S13 [Candidatus Kerfeldbacteria bacterium RIFCSPLOWO2_02_FULL_42_19]OGY85157.1 MAG: 30S ribosomal protein S13 [Candidatus Kerfeldbacteria bacterium RIFCSPLOWO2_12_FULL_43_9]